jgi:hypothetical protein
MKEIQVKQELIAFCGLYCGACGRYLKGRCPGCQENEKASWCKIRSCCIENNYSSCAVCADFENAKDCSKFDNFFGRVIGFLLRSDRNACINQIKTLGLEGHAKAMAELGRPSIRP